jgi:hypothetical protein
MFRMGVPVCTLWIELKTKLAPATEPTLYLVNSGPVLHPSRLFPSNREIYFSPSAAKTIAVHAAQ